MGGIAAQFVRDATDRYETVLGQSRTAAHYLIADRHDVVITGPIHAGQNIQF